MVLGLAIAFMILSLVGEVLVRTFGHVLPYEQDDELGWKPRAGLSARYKMRDQSGAEFDVAHSTMRDGFRAFGDLASPRKRVRAPMPIPVFRAARQHPSVLSQVVSSGIRHRRA